MKDFVYIINAAEADYTLDYEEHPPQVRIAVTYAEFDVRSVTIPQDAFEMMLRHYEEQKAAQEPTSTEGPEEDTCSFQGCINPRKPGYSWCEAHIDVGLDEEYHVLSGEPPAQNEHPQCWWCHKDIWPLQDQQEDEQGNPMHAACYLDYQRAKRRA